MSPVTRDGRWYPDPSTRPDRKHAAGVADAFAAARAEADERDRAFFDSLTEDDDSGPAGRPVA